jgi:hypothetical protein
MVFNATFNNNRSNDMSWYWSLKSWLMGCATFVSLHITLSLSIFFWHAHRNSLLRYNCIRLTYNDGLWLWFMVLNATFNNISVISWRSVMLVEETVVPREKHWQTLSHNVHLCPEMHNFSKEERCFDYKLTFVA